MKTKFTCEMFTTLEYKDWNQKRNPALTLAIYLERWAKALEEMKAHLKINSVILVSENCKGKSNDRYAKGNRYFIQGEVETERKLLRMVFHIYHTARANGDFHCVDPIRYSSIKIIKEN